jgi:hypothetical protein
MKTEEIISNVQMSKTSLETFNKFADVPGFR